MDLLQGRVKAIVKYKQYFHFSLLHLYVSRKGQKTCDFMTILEGIEMEH